MEQRYTGYRVKSKRQSLWVFTGITFVCFGSWVAGYLSSVGFPVYGGVGDAPLWNAFCKILPSKEITYLIGFILMMGGAVLLQKSNYELMLIREKSKLPFFLNIFLISTNPNFFPLNPASFGVFFLIVAISLLFSTYHRHDVRSTAFNISLIISLGSLLWIHILWFIPLFWYGMYKFRTLTVRAFLASLVGFVTIYWFLLGWCVWSRDFSPFFVFSSLFKIQLISFSYMDWINWIGMFLVAFVFLIAVVNIISHDLDDIQRTRHFLYLLVLFGFWSFALAVLFAQSADEFLQSACIPSSLLIAHFFTLSRGRVVGWLYYFTLLSFAVILSVRLWNFL
ncbi:MAG: hypothetical protein PHG27_00355 [Massilibacteroides sp.]|nr:hypothetical protein [Massilibacteroides sp.]MDD3061983.1 hypothetical protein [Massilibacteroides sp.]MDD4114038.1 hypothetical protein [Massilibacteroides sp.]MDD4659300.1 hypothetical protein [Massilibacteroides sp.]